MSFRGLLKSTTLTWFRRIIEPLAGAANLHGARAPAHRLGNVPCETRRKIVLRDKPVRFLTAGKSQMVCLIFKPL